MKDMQMRFMYLLYCILLFFPTDAFCVSTSMQVYETTTLDAQAWITIAITALTFVALLYEVRPPEIVLLMTGALLVVFGILPPHKFLQGFSSDIIVTIAMLCIVVKALEIHGVITLFVTTIMPKTHIYYKQLISLILPTATLSAFINNTPIVLLMTPVIRKWALQHKLRPSKFLIPLAYASTLGGMCTIIGTSTNLVVEGMLRNSASGVQLSFFELAYIGIPCVLIGTLYLVCTSNRLLPERLDPASAIHEQTREFTAEFVVCKDCPLIGHEISQVQARHFSGLTLIQIERKTTIIHAPNPEISLQENDRLIFAGDIHQIAAVHAIAGLRSAQDPHFQLDVSSSHFSEIVLSTSSAFVGKTIKELHFRHRLGASVLAVYRDGKRMEGNVGRIVLKAGDTLMLLSSDELYEAMKYSKDFYTITLNEKLAVYNPWRAGVVLATLAGIVIAASMGVAIVKASLAGALILILTKTITIRQAQQGIVWNLLLLIASSFAIATALETTGVADRIAKGLVSIAGHNPYLLIGGVVLAAMASSELLSNNATALILVPIALHVGILAGYDSESAMKSMAVAVAVGSSCCFALPTGYHTYMIVYGPGGYKFKDFIKVGIALDVVILLLATWLIPKIWPLY